MPTESLVLLWRACACLYVCLVLWRVHACLCVCVCIWAGGWGFGFKKPYFIEKIRKTIISKSRRKKQGKDCISFRNMYVISWKILAHSSILEVTLSSLHSLSKDKEYQYSIVFAVSCIDNLSYLIAKYSILSVNQRTLRIAL